MQTRDRPMNSVQIEGIDLPTVSRYFETLNAEDFDATANLFATEGALHPPFEDPVADPEAIAAYLKTEAVGMTLFPREGISQSLEDGSQQVRVTGKVQTPWFKVNVAWQFILSDRDELLAVAVKLLASPQQLLEMRDKRTQA